MKVKNILFTLFMIQVSLCFSPQSGQDILQGQKHMVSFPLSLLLNYIVHLPSDRLVIRYGAICTELHQTNTVDYIS